MDSEDDPPGYYEVLGLSQGCSSDEIRRAYRTLALQHHPDRNPGNEEAAAHMFQLIGEAYEVLSDANKRQLYDCYGRAGLEAHECGAAPPPPPPSSSHRRGGGGFGFENDFGFRHAEDIFEAFFGGHNPFASMHQQQQGPSSRQRRRRPPFGPFGGGAFAAFDDDDSFFGNGSSLFGMASSLFGGGNGFNNNGGRSGSLFDDPAAFAASGLFASASASASSSSSSSSYSSSYSSTSYGGGSTRSVRRIVRVGLDGTRRIRTETTTTYADGRREVEVDEQVEEQQEMQLEAPPFSHPSLGYQYQQQQQWQG